MTNRMSPEAHNRLVVSAGAASVAAAVLLVSVKLWALGATTSLSVAASLADSTMDLMTSLAALAGIFYAAKPADEDHAFGHTSAEDLTALGQAVFILISAGAIAVAAAYRLRAPEPPQLTAPLTGIAVMVFAILVTGALVIWQTRVAHLTGNRIVAADRLHYLGDLLPNIGAIAALWASRQFGMASLDSIIALGTAAILALGAFRVGKGAFNALMDRQADQKVIDGIGTMARDWPGVHGYHDLKTRTAGSRIFVNLHIELDGDQTLRQAHDIGAGLRRAILERYPQTDVIIHKDVVQSATKTPSTPD
jgi:ferrous-iron efflux pump FieF